ncbi:unnamed protein product [Prorocentrum cordatum]|uniref:Uncharacterized protein n=1 Tax=Prorocentrum cordatum TaxID=2364126 RepID=A0ABN9SSB6_9DINO|nr:unnamed protein product [Polarella glacialis]
MAAGAGPPLPAPLSALLRLLAWCACCRAVQVPPVPGPPAPLPEEAGPAAARVVLAPREVEVVLERLDAEAEADVARRDAERRLERLERLGEEAEAGLQRAWARAELERLDAEAEARLERLSAGPGLGSEAADGGPRRLSAAGAARARARPEEGWAGGPPSSPEEEEGNATEPMGSPEEAMYEVEEEEVEEKDADKGHARLMAGAVHLVGPGQGSDELAAEAFRKGAPSWPEQAVNLEEDGRATARLAGTMEAEVWTRDGSAGQDRTSRRDAEDSPVTPLACASAFSGHDAVCGGLAWARGACSLAVATRGVSCSDYCGQQGSECLAAADNAGNGCTVSLDPQGRMLLSMLGVALSPSSRQFLKQTDHGGRPASSSRRRRRRAPPRQGNADLPDHFAAGAPLASPTGAPAAPAADDSPFGGAAPIAPRRSRSAGPASGSIASLQRPSTPGPAALPEQPASPGVPETPEVEDNLHPAAAARTPCWNVPETPEVKDNLHPADAASFWGTPLESPQPWRTHGGAAAAAALLQAHAAAHASAAAAVEGSLAGAPRHVPDWYINWYPGYSMDVIRHWYSKVMERFGMDPTLPREGQMTKVSIWFSTALRHSPYWKDGFSRHFEKISTFDPYDGWVVVDDLLTNWTENDQWKGYREMHEVLIKGRPHTSYVYWVLLNCCEMIDHHGMQKGRLQMKCVELVPCESAFWTATRRFAPARHLQVGASGAEWLGPAPQGHEGAGSAMKRQRTGEVSTSMHQQVLNMLGEHKGVRSARFVDALASRRLGDGARETTVGVLKGVWHKIGAVGGGPACRQEPIDDPAALNTSGLFLFYARQVEQGWARRVASSTLDVGAACSCPDGCARAGGDGDAGEWPQELCQDIKRDISDCSDLLAKRPGSEELQNNLAASLCSRMQLLPALSAPDAIVLTELLKEKCTVGSVKRAVLSAVDTKVANIATSAPSGITDAGLTGKDWMVLEDHRAAASVAGRVAQEGCEKQAFNALVSKGTRALKKKPAAADVAKKPSAATPALKTPAASKASKGDAVNIVFEPSDRQCTMNAFASRRRGRAFRWAKANGRNEKQLLIFAKDAYRSASETWRNKKNA